MATAVAAPVRERGIPMTAESVRAILDGRKTQTRRVVTPQPSNARTEHDPHGWRWKWQPPKRGVHMVEWGTDTRAWGRMLDYSPYGRPGDRLWVRETWRPMRAAWLWDLDVRYAADGAERTIRDGEFDEKDWTMPKAAERGNVSLLFMPRWASRITLELTGVRVERVQEISEADAIAEGIERSDNLGLRSWPYLGAPHPVKGTPKVFATAVQAYRSLWDALNAKRGFGWDANPWVWVLDFQRVD